MDALLSVCVCHDTWHSYKNMQIKSLIDLAEGDPVSKEHDKSRVKMNYICN